MSVSVSLVGAGRRAVRLAHRDRHVRRLCDLSLRSPIDLLDVDHVAEGVQRELRAVDVVLGAEGGQEVFDPDGHNVGGCRHLSLDIRR